MCAGNYDEPSADLQTSQLLEQRFVREIRRNHEQLLTKQILHCKVEGLCTKAIPKSECSASIVFV